MYNQQGHLIMTEERMIEATQPTNLVYDETVERRLVNFEITK